MMVALLDFVHQTWKKKVFEERKLSREAVGGSFRQCGVCKVGEKIMKRCSVVILSGFLTENVKHQQDCKRTQLDYKIFFLTDNQEKGKNRKTGQVFSRMTGDRPKKSHLIDKVIIMSSKLY